MNKLPASYFSDKELIDLGVDIVPGLSEEEVLELLARRISLLMEQSMETFFQIMYRLDIPEAGLSEAMSDINPERSIAELVLRRQRMKVESRSRFRQEREDTDDELRW